MSSSSLGSNISKPKVTDVSSSGFWLITTSESKYFLSFDDYPWFQSKPLEQVSNVEECNAGHYYWPDLDVDLSEEIIKNPSKYPLQANS